MPDSASDQTITQVNMILRGHAKLLIAYARSRIARNAIKNHVIAERKDGRDYLITDEAMSYSTVYRNLFRCSEEHKVLLINIELSSDLLIGRQRVPRRVHSASIEATDPTYGGLVSYSLKGELPYEDVPKSFLFRGGIIIVSDSPPKDYQPLMLRKRALEIVLSTKTGYTP